jgi:type I restriction enzyme M protein
MAQSKSKNNPSKSGELAFEAQLWAAADKMRGHMDASEYKHVSLGLIFLKYISDAFEEKREQLLFGFSDPKSDWFIKDEPQRAEAAENRDEYLAARIPHPRRAAGRAAAEPALERVARASPHVAHNGKPHG